MKGNRGIHQLEPDQRCKLRTTQTLVAGASACKRRPAEDPIQYDLVVHVFHRCSGLAAACSWLCATHVVDTGGKCVMTNGEVVLARLLFSQAGLFHVEQLHAETVPISCG